MVSRSLGRAEGETSLPKEARISKERVETGLRGRAPAWHTESPGYIPSII